MKVAEGYVTIRFYVCGLEVENDDLLAAIFPDGYDAECMGLSEDEIAYTETDEVDE